MMTDEQLTGTSESGPAPSNRGGARRRLWPILLTTLASLLAFEVLARLRALYEDRHSMRKALAIESVVEPDYKGHLRGFIHKSASLDNVYELRPGLDTIFWGQPLHTNSLGFRAHEYDPKKGPAVVRIVGLGDSVMFGWRQPDAGTFLALLEAELNRVHPELTWQCINTAVPGYNTVMEVATLEERALVYEPDLIVLCVTGNDLDLPHFISPAPEYFSLTRSFLWDEVSRRRPRSAPLQKAPKVGKREDRHIRHEQDMERRVDPKYRHLVGWEACEDSLHRLKAIADEREIPVVTVSWRTKHYASSRRILALTAELGFVHVDMEAVVERVLEEEGVAKRSKSDLVCSPKDGHPSGRSHALAAKELQLVLEEQGWIEEQLHR